MNHMSIESMKEQRAGWTKCKICGQNVYGGFWTKYYHCLKHAWNSVMPILELVAFCFGV